jgi:hypothetical protein
MSQLPPHLHGGQGGNGSNGKDLPYGDPSSQQSQQQFLQGLLTSFGLQNAQFAQHPGPSSSPINQPPMPVRPDTAALDMGLGTSVAGAASNEALSLIQATLASALQSSQPPMQTQQQMSAEGNTAASIAAILAAVQDTAAL